MEYREGYTDVLSEEALKKYIEKDFPRRLTLAFWKGKEDLFTLYELYFEGYPIELLEEGKDNLKSELAWWRKLNQPNQLNQKEVTKDKND